MRALLRTLKNALLGAICTTALPLSVVAVGWTQALSRRCVQKRWQRISTHGPALSTKASATRGDANWIRAAPSAPTGATLWRNLREGAATALNTFFLTLPAGALWVFGWHIGWAHSFHKSYEVSWVGPVAAALGVVLFVLAMLYLPLAQVHQAVVGNWRAFYQFSQVRAVMAANPLGCATLAAWYAIISLPIAALKTAPMFFDRLDGYATLGDAALLEQLESYFFWAGAVFFVGYAWLRTRAAKVYAEGLMRALETRALRRDSLAPHLQELTNSLALGDPPRSKGPLGTATAAVSSGGRVVWRCAMTAVAALLWLAFTAQIFVSEFLNYHGAQGWLNQPLIQLPWFQYLPPGLG